ncbi:hypothetical protein NP233_g2607 [Leucocoprinus birnbaumii]|uniref:Uncharacterized protein n=1 Tax=Leucocoprinus birnbaumii TaxID=56174 RepID=A0AAD5W1Y8_9AGAR|nr:hypothetical protein NP233_g2607 [Leucocoprinus birnbaumii]
MTVLETPPSQHPHFDFLGIEKGVNHSASDISVTSDLYPPLNAPLPLNRRRRKLYIRVTIFIVLEIIFLIFAYYTLLHPIPLQNDTKDELTLLSSLTVTLTEFKAGITAVAVVWHTIACFFVKDVIAAVCSAEFMAQYRRSGTLEPGKSDRVSTVTSSIFDNIFHFLGRSASREFRLGFMITLVLMTVGPLGSGTITVGSIPTSLVKPISIANVTGLPPSYPASAQAYHDMVAKANAILRLEGLGDTLFGYNMSTGDDASDSVLIPWPSMDFNERLPDQDHVVYRSDIVRFNYECSWLSNVSDLSTYPNDTTTIPRIGFKFESLNHDLYTYPPQNVTTFCGVVQLTLRLQSSLSDELRRIAFLFFNSDSLDSRGNINHDIITPPSNISLSDINESFLVVTRKLVGAGSGMSLAILDCNPRAIVVPGEVTASQNSLVAKQLPGTTNESTLVGNILSERGNVLPSAAFTLAFGDEATSLGAGLPTQALRDLFLRTRRAFSTGSGAFLRTGIEMEPLPLDEINRNMNRYAQAASKAFLDGTSMVTNGTALDKLNIEQTGEMFFPVAALVASKPFLICFTVVVLVIIDAIATVCSAEFMTQYRRSGTLEPGKSDRVSTVTSGIFDNILHFLGSSASREFRLTFMMALVLMTVGPLGSGTVTIGSLPTSVKKPISIANVTDLKMDMAISAAASREQGYNDFMVQANTIMRFEGLGNTMFGYKMGPVFGDDADSVLVPWPNGEFEDLPEQGRLIYRSDIVKFRYECSWVHNISDISDYPLNASNPSPPFHFMFQSSSDVYESPPYQNPSFAASCGVIQLTMRTSQANLLVPDGFRRMAFLLFNSNVFDSRGDINNSVPAANNITFSSINETFLANVQQSSLGILGMGLAVLDCDTHANVVPGEVSLSQNTLVARQIPGTTGANQSTLLGNLFSTKESPLPSAAFALAFHNEASSLDGGLPTRVVRDLFLRTRRVFSRESPPISFQGASRSGVEMEPLSLDEINKNMGRYAQSASKVFLDGSIIVANGDVQEKLYMTQTGELLFPVAALVASKSFLIAFTVVIVVITVVFAFLLWTVREAELRPFDLSCLIHVLGTEWNRI